MFLKKVKVKKFAHSIKDSRGRNVGTYENENPDDIYYIVGKTFINEGDVIYDSEEGTYFSMKTRHMVYIIAKTIGRRFKVLPQDIEEIEE